MIYLSFPRMSGNEMVQDKHFRKACDIAARLIEWGVVVYNPMAISTTSIKYGNCGISDWSAFNKHVMQRCTCLVQVQMEGYEHDAQYMADKVVAQNERLPIITVEDSEWPHNDIVRALERLCEIR